MHGCEVQLWAGVGTSRRERQGQCLLGRHAGEAVYIPGLCSAAAASLSFTAVLSKQRPCAPHFICWQRCTAICLSYALHPVPSLPAPTNPVSSRVLHGDGCGAWNLERPGGLPREDEVEGVVVEVVFVRVPRMFFS